jgi:hypothetical protein
MAKPSSLNPIFFTTNLIPFVGNKLFVYLYYTWYAVRSTFGNGPNCRCWRRSVSVSKSLEVPHGFCKRLIGNEVLNDSPDNFFTRDIATNESLGVKSVSPRSMTALSNVNPWLL